MKLLPTFAAFRFEAFSPLWRAALLVLLVVAGAAFLFWTYWGIYRRSGGRRLAWWLLGLRCVGLLLLLLMLAGPVWTRQRERTDPGRVAIVVDTSRSMTLPDATGASRYARAKEAADKIQKALDKGTGPRLKVELFDVNGALLKELPAEPTAGSTDLTKALKKVTARLRSRQLAGVVLISDGVDNTGRQTFTDWDEAGAVIHGVGFPQPVERDLSVRTPQAPRRVLVHNAVPVAVPVGHKGPGETNATVTLRRGREVLATKKVRLPAGDGEQVVSLTCTPDQPGTFELTAEVSRAAGEKDVSNNAINFPLEVGKEPIRVLYLEGYLRYEARFLKERLEDDPDVSLATFVRRLSPDQPAAEASKPKVTEAELNKFDVLILGDMEAAYLDRPAWEAIVRWLDGRNHSLLVLGGYTSFGPQGLRTTPLAERLPVVFAGGAEQQRERPFQLRLTEEGQAHPIFALGDDRVASTKQWHAAAPLDGLCLVQEARKGAAVLAVHPQAEAGGKPAVVIATQRAPGGGQVMALTIDTTWRWGREARARGEPDRLYGRFWSQTIRWLAGRSLDDSRPPLAVSTGKALHDVNEKAVIQVRRLPRPGADLADTRIVVDVINPKGRAVPGLAPSFSKADPNLATVEFTPGEAGRYEVVASLRRGDKVVDNVTTELRVRGADLELETVSTRPDHLKALAEATGGTYREVDDAEEVAAKLTRSERRQSRLERKEYWDSPWLFGAFLLAVTGEWFLRRRNHLV
jgi:hypothetical protein